MPPSIRLVCRLAPALLFLGLLRGLAASPDPDGAALLQSARRAIDAYHAGQPRADGTVRVVYFHPSDRDPLPDHAARLERIMTDVSAFYREGLLRFGLETDGVPLERKEGRLVLHVVRGKKPAAGYSYESGDDTKAEVRAALKGTVDLDREHVIVIYGLSHREPDGRHVFAAPYYGDGTQRSGVSHAADCERLDPTLLHDTHTPFVFTEHYYALRRETVASFNSMYLGGIAHELGHGLGLPHDSGNAAEEGYGTSLMGLGNLTYRNDRWGGPNPAFLSRTSALRLASHPLITRSNRGRWEPLKGGIDALTFSVDDGGLRIHGKAGGSIASYAVVASVWPERDQEDHRARTAATAVELGEFSLTINPPKAEPSHLRIDTLHVNGASDSRRFLLTFDASGRPDIAALNASWLVDQAVALVRQEPARAREFVTEAAIAAAPTADAKRKLALLRQALVPAEPLDVARVTTDRVYLSDARWTSARVGWGQVSRNVYMLDPDDRAGVFLVLRGQLYDKGLYAHSASQYAFDLGGKWRTFSGAVGLRDGARPQGSAVFTVRGDGRTLHRTGALRAGQIAQIRVDVTGVKELELLAEGGEGHIHNSWAVWADPLLRR